VARFARIPRCVAMASFRDPSGNNIRLTQVLEFDPARGAAP